MHIYDDSSNRGASLLDPFGSKITLLPFNRSFVFSENMMIKKLASVVLFRHLADNIKAKLVDI